MRRVVSLSLTDFVTDRLQRRQPVEQQGRALVVVGRQNGRLVVEAACALARAEGVRVGQGLADARALLPTVRIEMSDAAADHRALSGLADWCNRYTPWTALSQPESGGAAGLWLDITGCGHLFGGEAALLADLTAKLAEFGWRARAACAPTPGAAWAWARFAPAGAEPLLADLAATRSHLAGLPVAALRLPAGLCQDAQRLGLERIGALAGLARAPLVARLGQEVALRLDQAFGRIEEPIAPRRPVPSWRVARRLAEPLCHLAGLELAARSLLEELAERLEQGGRGARRLELAIWRLDGAVRRLPVGMAQPSRDIDHLHRLLRGHLDKLDLGDGIEALALAALDTEILLPQQIGLVADTHQDAAMPAHLIDRLAARMGPDRVLRPMTRSSHVPERAGWWQPVLTDRADHPAAASLTPPAPATRRRVRPARLLARPEKLDGVMAPVPDDPPVLFRWRGAVHRVRRADGPERIGGEWWLEDVRPRDYYRVEDTEGRRFWLYRDGALGDSQAPGWYLHGLFA